jgi:hypothetical protein
MTSRSSRPRSAVRSISGPTPGHSGRGRNHRHEAARALRDRTRRRALPALRAPLAERSRRPGLRHRAGPLDAHLPRDPPSAPQRSLRRARPGHRAALRAIAEHGATTDFSSPLTAARTNIGPAWLEWLIFPHQVNYHIEHHLYASVPHYNLPALHREMAARGVLEGAELVPFRATLTKIFAERRLS